MVRPVFSAAVWSRCQKHGPQSSGSTDVTGLSEKMGLKDLSFLPQPQPISNWVAVGVGGDLLAGLTYFRNYSRSFIHRISLSCVVMMFFTKVRSSSVRPVSFCNRRLLVRMAIE